MSKSIGFLQTRSVLLLAVVASAYGHGNLTKPAPRNWIAHLRQGEYCPHCLNRDGGGGAVAPGKKTYQPGGSLDTGVVTETYVEGQVITVAMKVIENHKGFWRLSVCDRREFTDACFKQNVLQAVGKKGWKDASGTWSYIGLNDEGSIVHGKYKLPAGLTCTHCTMQWVWVTGNTCRPPTMDKAYVEQYSPNLTECGPNYLSPSAIIPEKFWNVVDIRINSASISKNASKKAIRAPVTKPAAVPRTKKAAALATKKIGGPRMKKVAASRVKKKGDLRMKKVAAPHMKKKVGTFSKKKAGGQKSMHGRAALRGNFEG